MSSNRIGKIAHDFLDGMQKMYERGERSDQMWAALEEIVADEGKNRDLAQIEHLLDSYWTVSSTIDPEQVDDELRELEDQVKAEFIRLAEGHERCTCFASFLASRIHTGNCPQRY